MKQLNNSSDAMAKSSISMTLSTTLTSLGFATVAVAVYLVNNNLITLSGKTTASDLKSFGARLDFTVRYFALIGAWIGFNVFYVVSKRVSTGAMNPMKEKDDTVEGKRLRQSSSPLTG